MAPKPILAEKRASVSDAKIAYFDGDFERCLAICVEIRVRSIATASEVALLSARAFLRTGRAAEAEAALAGSIGTHRSLDAILTAEMLLGAARIRQGDPDDGLALLTAAAARADDAHLAIRSEIAFSTALGYWAKRDIDRARAFLALVDERSDIIHARALELQAWCLTARGDHRGAADAFMSTLLRLETCHAQDRKIAAVALSTLAISAAELFDPEIARVVGVRSEQMDWSAGLTAHRYIILAHQALFYEFAGDTVTALEFAIQAREAAPTVPFEVYGLGLCSALSRNAGETHSAIVYAKRALRLLQTLDARDLVDDERFSMLVVAENCAHFDVEIASELYAQYWGLAPADAMIALAGDPRLAGEETYVAGVIAQARGDMASAQRCFRKAFEIFRPIGYVRRAVAAAFALSAIVDDPQARDYVAAQTVGISNYITTELRRRDGSSGSIGRHPIVASLPPAQREVVALVCAGKSNREIADLRQVGEQTIKNMLTKHVFRAFGVSSRAALVSSCLSDSARSVDTF